MKESFILFTEQKAVIDKLTDEQAGKLFKAIYEYVSTDKMPPLDNLLDLVMTPIKISLDKNKEKYEEVSKARAEAGSKGGKQKVANQANASKSKQKVANQADNDNEYDNDNEDVIVEENKEKKIYFADFVTMTNAEHEKLVSTYGKEIADQCIEKLSNYKGAHGKKYKSDYRAILNWVVDEVKGKQKQTSATKPNQAYKDLATNQYNDLSKYYAN